MSLSLVTSTGLHGRDRIMSFVGRCLMDLWGELTIHAQHGNQQIETNAEGCEPFQQRMSRHLNAQILCQEKCELCRLNALKTSQARRESRPDVTPALLPWKFPQLPNKTLLTQLHTRRQKNLHVSRQTRSIQPYFISRFTEIEKHTFLYASAQRDLK